MTPSTAIVVVAGAAAAALVVLAYRWWSTERHFVWRTTDIRAEILRDDELLKIGQYLNLDQKLRPGESGWTNMKIDIPEHWQVQCLTVQDGRIVLALSDGSEFCLTRRNVGRLSFDILDGGNKPDDVLHQIWKRYAAVNAV